MEKEILITVGFTTYNAIETIEKSINSALSQLWHPIEIIVVDDCSEDGTYSFLQKVAQKISSVKLFRNKINSGVSVSRNRIIAEAKGEFLIFFDDDDVSMPDRILEQYERIKRYEEKYGQDLKIVCHTARQLVYMDGSSKVVPTIGQKLNISAPHGYSVFKRVLLGSPLRNGYGSCATCSQMARLSTYKEIGGFDPNLRRSEDTDFVIRLALAGGHFVGVSKPLVIQNMTYGSEKSLVEECRNMNYLITKFRNDINNDEQYQFILRWLELRKAWLEDRKYDFLVVLLILVKANPILFFQRIFCALHNITLNLNLRKFYSKHLKK
jgi:glycosyltransferase involved in cell wall biosynthesis